MIYIFGEYSADVNRLEVKRKGSILNLEPKALRVLLYLLQHRERVVTKEELIATIWEGTFVTDNALTRVIAQLRRELGDHARAPEYIETSATVGYRFIARVREAEADAAASIGHRRWWTVAVAGVVVAGGMLAWTTGKPAAKWVQLSGVRQVTSSAAADLWPSFSPDGSQIAFSSNRSGVFELYVRSLALSSADRQITRDGEEGIQPAWSPDGKYIAYVARRHGGIGLVPVSGGATRYLTDFGDTPSWSPDGRRLVFRASSLDLNPAIETSGAPETTLWITAVDAGPPQPLTRKGVPPGGHNFPRWSSDGNNVVFSSSGTGKAWVVEVETGRVTAIEIEADAIRSPWLSPDGGSFYWIGAGKEPGLWYAQMDRKWRAAMPSNLMPASGSTPRDAALSADGKQVAFSQQMGESSIWSVPLKDGTAAGEPRALIRDRSVRNSEPSFSADGTKLAYSSIRQGGEWTVFTANADGSKALPVTAPDQNSGRVSWFGNELTIGFRTVRKAELNYWLLPLNGAPRRLQLKMNLDRAERLRLSRDGSRLVAQMSTPDGSQVVVEDLATHAIRKLTPEGRDIGYPSWSPDGKWIAAQEHSGRMSSIVYLSAEGGEIHSLATGMVQSFNHDWAPDSDRILFAGLHDGVWDIFWISRTTGHVEQLTHFTNQSAFVRYPAWSPKNDQVVFERNDISANVYVGELK